MSIPAPIGRWCPTLDDPETDTTAPDISGNGNDGTFQGSTTTDSDAGGRHYDCNSSGRGITLPDIKALCSDTEWTVAAWLYLKSAAAISQWFSYRVKATGTFEGQLCRYSSGSSQVFTGEGSGWDNPTGSSLALNAWRLVSIRFSGSTMTHQVNETSDITSTSVSPSFTSGTAYFGIGNDYRPSASDQYFRGLIDDVSVWDVALTDDNISDLFSGGRGYEYSDAVVPHPLSGFAHPLGKPQPAGSQHPLSN